MHTRHADGVTTVHTGLVCTKPDWQVLDTATFLENKVLPGTCQTGSGSPHPIDTN